jgi:molybdenum cofactor guanylyltransferase
VPASIEVCILAGGLSTRMGRDKARLRLGGRSMLAYARAAARATGLPVRLVRRDLVPRCGPLSGVFTALTQTKAEVVVFLSCDQPFVTDVEINRVARLAAVRSGAVFIADAAGTMGFPFAVPAAKLALVAGQIEHRQYSLQKLAGVLKARRLRFPRGGEWRGFNVNTPADLRQARQWWSAQTSLVSPAKSSIVAP